MRRLGRLAAGLLGCSAPRCRGCGTGIVFQTVILQQDRQVTASHAIRRRIEKRLDAWGAGNHAMVVGDTLRSCKEYLTAARREEMAEHWAQTYHSLVLHGKLQSAVRWITEGETGGVLQPGDRCEKTGDRVLEVLRAKHRRPRRQQQRA